MSTSIGEDERQFWQLISQSRGSNKLSHEKQIKNLTKILSALRPLEIVRFNETFHHLLRQSYTWKLWGAASVINGGCSDDTFDYFRSWLIGQGQKIYYDAIQDPETLAGLIRPKDEYDWEGLEYCAIEAYEKVTGASMESQTFDFDLKVNLEPTGKPWSDKDLPLLFPKLWKIYSQQNEYQTRKETQRKQINPGTIAAIFRAEEMPKPIFWITKLKEKGYDIGLRMIGEPESDTAMVSQENYVGYLIQLKARIPKNAMGILISHISWVRDGRVRVEFQNFDKKLTNVFNDITLLLTELDDVKLQSGNVEFSSFDWKTYLKTGMLP